jgi:hypothetical protein
MLRHREGLPLGFLSELFDRDEDFVAAEEPELKRGVITGENGFAGNLQFFITDEFFQLSFMRLVPFLAPGAGVSDGCHTALAERWIPAFAGMTFIKIFRRGRRSYMIKKSPVDTGGYILGVLWGEDLV